MYTEWIHEADGISFITNAFNRVLYINTNYPDGDYTKMETKGMKLNKELKQRCVKGRTFNQEDLIVELI